MKKLKRFPKNKNIKIVPEKRAVKNFSSHNTEFSNCFKKEIDYPELIINLNEEKFEDALEIINTDQENICYYFSCIEYAMTIRPQNRRVLFNFLCIIAKKYRFPRNKVISKDLKSLLIRKGILDSSYYDNKQEKTVNEILDLFAESTVEKVIKEDDCEMFIKITSEPFFDPKERFVVDADSPMFFVNGDSSLSYLQLMAFFGSIKCFKYAYMDDSFDKTWITKYAIAGGNLEIIKILNDDNVTFDLCFEIAVKFHQNKVCDWILDNSACEIFPTHKNIEYYNNRAFVFMIKNKLSPTSTTSPEDSFFAAAKTDNWWMMKNIIDSFSINVNIFSKGGKTALHIAVERDNLFIVKNLFEARIDCRLEDKFGSKTALCIAAERGEEDICVFLYQHMQKAGMSYGLDGKTPLLIAAENGHYNTVKSLIEVCNAPTNQKSKEGDSLFQLATESGNVKILEYLVEKGICSSATEKHFGKNRTALHYAVDEDNFELCKFIATNFKMLVDEIDGYGRTALQIAINNNNIFIVRLLIEQFHANITEADVELSDSNEITSLLKYVQSIHEYCQIDNQVAVNKLIGDNNNYANTKFNGNTLLHIAVERRNILMIKNLLENFEIDTKIVSSDGLSIRECALATKDIQVIKLINENTESDPQISQTIIQKQESIATKQACIQKQEIISTKQVNQQKQEIISTKQVNQQKHENIVTKQVNQQKHENIVTKQVNQQKHENVVTKQVNQQKQESIATKQANTQKQDFIDTRQIITQKQETQNKKEQNKIIVNMFKAVRNNEVENVRYYIEELHMDVETKDNQMTALYVATKDNLLEMSKYLLEECNANINEFCPSALINAVKGEKYEFIQYFSENYRDSINPNFVDKKGKSALHYAAEKNKNRMIELISIGFNTDVNIKDKKQRTPLFIASEKGNLEMMHFLIDCKDAEIGKLHNNALKKALEKDSVYDVKFLINKCNANINITDNNIYKLIIAYATKHQITNIVDFLQKEFNLNDADLAKKELIRTVTSNDKKEFYNLCRQIGDAEFLHFKDCSGKTILHHAVESNVLEMVKILVEEFHFDINALDNSSKSPLTIAFDKKNTEMIIYLVEHGGRSENITQTGLAFAFSTNSIPLIDILINKFKIDINKPIKKGRNALNYAIARNDLDGIKLLIEKYNADLEYVDENHKTPIQNAINHGNCDVVAYLYEKCNARLWVDGKPVYSEAKGALKKYFDSLISKNIIPPV